MSSEATIQNTISAPFPLFGTTDDQLLRVSQTGKFAAEMDLAACPEDATYS